MCFTREKLIVSRVWPAPSVYCSNLSVRELWGRESGQHLECGTTPGLWGTTSWEYYYTWRVGLHLESELHLESRTTPGLWGTTSWDNYYIWRVGIHLESGNTPWRVRIHLESGTTPGEWTTPVEWDYSWRVGLHLESELHLESRTTPKV